MASWSKIKFFHDTMLGSAGSTFALTAGSTAAGDYDVKYLYNMIETNMWKASSTAHQQFDYDAGAGNAKSADYLAILSHNLKTAGGKIDLNCSNDLVSWQTVVNDTPFADTVFLKEFNATTPHRYWRLNINCTIGSTVAPYMTLCIWGNKTELDYATASFDPYEQNVKANVNLSQGGYVTGVHTQYTERSLSLRFDDADATLYGKIKSWWETSGLKNFFVAWENANSPDDVWLMRPDPKFSNPLTNGGLYRNITLNLKGRKE
ncbi:hypothetical protein EPN18_10005 [bacterium]|nr:MAG: hypothetical protein EPN18_10005 [bacterium]